MNKEISVLIPTYNRMQALSVTLMSLYYQKEENFDVIISNQSETVLPQENEGIQTLIRLLAKKDVSVKILQNLPRKGMAQQRDFLLQQSHSRLSIFLDDDVILEPSVLQNMKMIIDREQCGFVGSALIGLSYQKDVRENEQQIEFWRQGVRPETVVPGSHEWQRHKLHNAANIDHVAKKFHLTASNPDIYKVAWIGGCVMYDTQKLIDSGGFDFWKNLPESHCGEDVLAQLRVMKLYGGCGIVPSGVYHQELATTIPDRTVNAPEWLKI